MIYKCFFRLTFALMVTVVLLAISPIASATLFDLRGTEGASPGGVEGAMSNSVTVDGIEATLTANDGILNHTGSGFGVNAAGSGDATQLLDDGSVIAESVTVIFDVPVVLTSLQLSDFAGTETASLTVAGNLNNLNATGSANDIYPFNDPVNVGQSIVLLWTSGNGFSFDNFEVTAVPEPTTLALLVMGLLGMVKCRR